jgi:hypothetical protein
MPRAAYFDGPGHLFSLMLVCSTARDGLKKGGGREVAPIALLIDSGPVYAMPASRNVRFPTM